MLTQPSLLPKKAWMEFYNFSPPPQDLTAEVLAGLSRPQKILSPKFFYDEEGSRLFGEICKTPEYYITRAETALLKEKGPEMKKLMGDPCTIIEYGCGSSEKIFILLSALEQAQAYAAIDISEKPLLELAAAVTEAFPLLHFIALCADFLKPLRIPLNGKGRLPKIAFFPGSSIGNFDPPEAKVFLENISRTVGHGGQLLIGVDLKKESGVLNRAYNDKAGLTAAFNKNLLKRINRECGGNFDLSRFEHRAFYNEEKGRIEMHLESLRDQTLRIGQTLFDFKKGETLHTENSYKYHIDEFQALAAQAGWRPRRVWTDAQRLFSLHCFETN